MAITPPRIGNNETTRNAERLTSHSHAGRSPAAIAEAVRHRLNASNTIVAAVGLLALTTRHYSCRTPYLPYLPYLPQPAHRGRSTTPSRKAPTRPKAPQWQPSCKTY